MCPTQQINIVKDTRLVEEITAEENEKAQNLIINMKLRINVKKMKR